MIKRILKKVILIILLIVLIYVCYAKYIRKDDVVKLGKYGILVVLTNSMEPEIKEKELIVIKEQTEYDLDDIVTYLDSKGILITHRILQIDEYSFMAKGDNNKVVDENTDIKAIQGKVVYHSKVLGIFVIYYLKAIILVCFVLWLAFKIKNKNSKEENSVPTKERQNIDNS